MCVNMRIRVKMELVVIMGQEYKYGPSVNAILDGRGHTAKQVGLLSSFLDRFLF